MSAPEVESAFKVVVKGGDTKLTVARLNDALNTLHAKGVPEWADVEVNRQPGRESTGWAMVAKWDPDKAPARPSPVIINPATGVTEDDVRGIQRRILDHPQA